MASQSSRKRSASRSKANTKKKRAAKRRNKNSPIGMEVAVLFSLAAAIFLMISNFGVGGFVGKTVSSFFFGLFGWMEYIFPRELDEAAYMEGCNFFQMMWRVIFPLCKPIVSVVVITSFISAWNEYPFSLILIGDENLRTISIGIRFNLAAALTMGHPLRLCYRLNRGHLGSGCLHRQ